MQPNSPSSFSGRLGVVFGAAVLRGILHLGDGSLLASLGGCALVLGTLAWLEGQGRGGASPERRGQSGPTPLDPQIVPTVLTIVIGFLMFLGPFFGLAALALYFHGALNPKNRKDGQKITLSTLLPLLFRAGKDREQMANILAAFQTETAPQAATTTPSEPAPKPKPKPPAARPATEPLAPPSTWGTLEPAAETRADWFNAPVAERTIAQIEPTPALAAGEVAPFHVAPASALGDWSLGSASAITTSSVQTVSYDPPTDRFESERAPSGFDEALAMLQAKPADRRRD